MLEDRHIIRNQVSYDSVEPSFWGVIESESHGTSVSSNAEDDNVTTKTDKASTSVTATAAKVESDLSRQTGDTESYRIFLRSLGWVAIVALVVLSLGHTVLQKMPRSLSLNLEVFYKAILIIC